jgi:membrane associated rhomboid family serine protease
VTGGSSFFFSPSEVSAGRNYQGMLLSHFAHADGTHLLFNMMTLYFFCIVLIPDIRALGASDSVTGIIFAAIVLLPGMSVYFFVVPVPIPAPLFAVGSHEAHLAGAVSGLLLAGLLAPGGFGPLLHRIQNLLT